MHRGADGVWDNYHAAVVDVHENGPSPGKPAVVGVGMRGDRVAIVFALPMELSSFIKQRCD